MKMMTSNCDALLPRRDESIVTCCVCERGSSLDPADHPLRLFWIWLSGHGVDWEVTVAPCVVARALCNAACCSPFLLQRGAVTAAVVAADCCFVIVIVIAVIVIGVVVVFVVVFVFVVVLRSLSKARQSCVRVCVV